MKKIFLSLSIFLFSISISAKENKPLCSKLTDDFCEELWSPKYKGNMVTKDYAFYLGELDKSEIYLRTKMYLENFIAHEKDYPEDFQKKSAEFIQKTQKVLSEESSDPNWYDKILNILDEIPMLIRSTATDRLNKDYLKFNNTKWPDKTQQEKTLYKTYYVDLYRNILDIQYANSNEWKRVVRIFDEVKKDMLEMIDQKFPVSVRDLAKIKIKNIKLSLPYPDPRNIKASNDCAMFDTNAFYNAGINQFTVCIGRINAIQDDANFYIVIAHEMSHAIDPWQTAIDQFVSSDLLQPIVNMCNASKPTMTCAEWKKYVEKFQSNGGFKMEVSPYDNLTSCLSSRDGLAKFEKEALIPVAKRKVRSDISEYAEGYSFSFLSQKTLRKNGKLKSNEYYMRPDLLKISDNGDLPSERTCGGYILPELFTQIAACVESDPQNRSATFKKTILELRSFLETMKMKWFQNAGRESADLEGDNFAIDSAEKFADWVSFRLLAKRLSREPTLEAKRSFVARSGSSLCTKPGPLRDAADLTKTEQQFSLEPHPDNRVRRLAVFQPEVVDAVQCQPTPEVLEGSHSCNFE